jgi:hypothetical protein
MKVIELRKSRKEIVLEDNTIVVLSELPEGIGSEDMPLGYWYYINESLVFNQEEYDNTIANDAVYTNEMIEMNQLESELKQLDFKERVLGLVVTHDQSKIDRLSELYTKYNI